MGVAERDYIRNRPQQRGGYGGGSGGGPLTSMSMWSVNTWLIAICVVVFMIDPFLPARDVVVHVEPTISTDDWNALDTSLLKVDGKRNPKIVDSRSNLITGYQIVYLETPQGNIEVARQHFQVMHLLQSLGHFSTERGFLKVEFWRLIGFQFLHFRHSLSYVFAV